MEAAKQVAYQIGLYNGEHRVQDRNEYQDENQDWEHSQACNDDAHYVYFEDYRYSDRRYLDSGYLYDGYLNSGYYS